MNCWPGAFMKNALLIPFLLIFFSATVLAKEEILSITDNDDNDDIYYLVVNVDDSTETLKTLYKDTYRNGIKVRRDNLNPDHLKSEEGMILEKRDEYNVLNLKSDNFDYERGGRIILDTLYNAITGDRRSFDLELSRDQMGWKLFRNKKMVSKFHVKVNRVIVLGTIGIKSIITE